MEIFYTNQLIWWSNKGQDFMETEQFNTYFTWTKLPDNKGINWRGHYSADFYATSSFDATYFKVIKGGKEYYFYVLDYVNDSANGRFYSLALDFYNTYTRLFIDKMKQINPKVFFKRKHAKRGSKGMYSYIHDQRYMFNVPAYLENMGKYVYPTRKVNLEIEAKKEPFLPESGLLSWLKGESGWKKHVNKYKFDERQFHTRSSNGTWYIRLLRPGRLEYKPGPGIDDDRYVFWAGRNPSAYLYYPLSQDPRYEYMWRNDQNSITAANIPPEYIVDFVLLPFPPSKFAFGDRVETIFYRNDAFKDVKGYMFYDGVDMPGWHTFYLKSGYRQQIFENYYNINYIDSEPMIHFPPFTQYLINDLYTLPVQYMIDDDPDCQIRLDFQWVMGSTINFYFSSFANPGQYMTNRNASTYCLIEDNKFEFVSDTLKNYLLNNTNSMNTSINLANEQRIIQDKFANYSAAAGVALGFAGTALAGVDMGMAQNFLTNEYTTMYGSSLLNQGMGQGISGLSQMVNSVIQVEKSLAMNEFNNKATIERIDATVKDVANKAGVMSDGYGKGLHSMINNGCLFYTKYELPEEMKKVVFLDFYWNGYLVNGIFDFNSYNNRRVFNYLEIGDLFQHISINTKFPQKIKEDMNRQLEKGFRLWKIHNPKFDGTVNNIEV